MMEAVFQMKPPQRFILDNFFPASKVFTSKTVEVDIYKQKRRIATFQDPLMEGKKVDRIGYKTRSYAPAYLKPKMVTTAEDILNTRSPGVNAYANESPSSRAAEQLGRDMAELDSMITRRIEWMAFQALQTGEITIVSEGDDARTVEFDFDPDHIVTLTNLDAWNATGAGYRSNPIQDLIDWRKLVMRDSGVAPTDVILGNNAATAFLNHPVVRDWFNRLNFIPGQIKPTVSENVINYGFLSFIGMNLYTVNEFFIDPADGLEYEMLDPNKVLMLSNTAGATAVLYGAIHDLGSLQAVPRFMKTWVDNDPSARWIQMHSAPLPVINQPDAFFVATVVDEDGSDSTDLVEG
jgi:hypothetical protein